MVGILDLIIRLVAHRLGDGRFQGTLQKQEP